MDERVKKEYFKVRAEAPDMPCRDAMRWAKGRLRAEFEKKLVGFSFSAGSTEATYAGDVYKVEADYDPDGGFWMQEEVNIERSVGAREYEWGSYRELERRAIAVLRDGIKNRMEWAPKGMSRHGKFLWAVRSCKQTLDRYEEYHKGDTSEYVVRVEGPGVDECCGGVDWDEIENFVWDAIHSNRG